MISDMLAHVERHQNSCLIAAVSGMAGGSANIFHLVNTACGFISSFLGAVIAIVTIVGMIRSWLKKRHAR